MIEPLVNVLQSKRLDLFLCKQHIKRIANVLNEHRANADIGMQSLMDGAEEFAENIGVELRMPRTTTRQTQRSNPPSSNFTDYSKKSILIPYLDSLIMNLNIQFPDDNLPAYSLLQLHSSNMLKLTQDEMRSNVDNFAEFYGVENLKNEIELWREAWKEKNLTTEGLTNLELCEVIKEAGVFFLSVKQSLMIALALPCTTCTIERSFSTMKRVKTWLRSTMIGDRLTGIVIR